MSFSDAVELILALEGGYVDDPDDRGGATRYGITQATYSGWLKGQRHPDHTVNGLTREEAIQIYHDDYWEVAHCPAIAAISQGLAVVHFDAAVNHGVRMANRLLQRVAGVSVDGRVGPLTLSAVQLQVDGNEPGIIKAYLGRRQAVYESLAQHVAGQGKFLKGWLRRLERVANAAGVLWP